MHGWYYDCAEEGVLCGNYSVRITPARAMAGFHSRAPSLSYPASDTQHCFARSPRSSLGPWSHRPFDAALGHCLQLPASPARPSAEQHTPGGRQCLQHRFACQPVTPRAGRQLPDSRRTSVHAPGTRLGKTVHTCGDTAARDWSAPPRKPASAPAMASDRPPQPIARANHHAQQLVLPVVVTSYIGHLTPLLLERVRARCRPVELHGKGRVHLVCPGRCESGAHRLQTA